MRSLGSPSIFEPLAIIVTGLAVKLAASVSCIYVPSAGVAGKVTLNDPPLEFNSNRSRFTAV